MNRPKSIRPIKNAAGLATIAPDSQSNGFVISFGPNHRVRKIFTNSFNHRIAGKLPGEKSILVSDPTEGLVVFMLLRELNTDDQQSDSFTAHLYSAGLWIELPELESLKVQWDTKQPNTLEIFVVEEPQDSTLAVDAGQNTSCPISTAEVLNWWAKKYLSEVLASVQ